MRRLSPFVFVAAASLILCTSADDAAAGARGHGFGKSAGRHFAGRHFGGHRHGFRHSRSFHHGRFGRGALFGGFAPGYFDNGYGGQQPLYIQQNVATSANAYSIVDMPGSTGIRSEPAAQPVIYVIKGPEARHEPVLMRKGSRDRPGAKMLAVNPGREVATGSAPTASGPRIVEVTARRGL